MSGRSAALEHLISVYDYPGQPDPILREVLSEAKSALIKDHPDEYRQAIYPFACLADTLPEAIRPEETVTLEIKAVDLMVARKAYLEGM